MHKLAAKTLVIPAILMIVFLFFGKISHIENRVFQEAWQTGHFFLFAALSYIFIQLPRIRDLKKSSLFLLVLLLSSGIGLLTEYIQFAVGRSFEYRDLFNDVIGAVAGFVAAQISRNESWSKNSLGLLGITLLTLLALHKFLLAGFDAWHLEKKFPVIADLESPFQELRWAKNSVNIRIDRAQVREGEKALKVHYKTSDYPHAVLQQFVRDWRDYKTFHFSIHNPDKKEDIMVIAIEDVFFKNAPDYQNNRFSKKIKLQPGWNDFVINVKDIQNSPTNRKLDISKLAAISFVLIKPQKEKYFSIDSLYLSRD